jgi:hypothetical protein
MSQQAIDADKLTSQRAVVEPVSQLRKETGEKKLQGFPPFVEEFNNPNIPLRESTPR